MSHKKKFDELVNDILNTQHYRMDRYGDEYEDDDGDWLRTDEIKKIIKKYDPKKIKPKPPKPPPIGAGYPRTIKFIYNQILPEDYEFDK